MNINPVVSQVDVAPLVGTEATPFAVGYLMICCAMLRPVYDP
jgi:hypothetical protein